MTSMAAFSDHLSIFFHRPVIDRTGLSGLYDFKVQTRDVLEGMARISEPATGWAFGDLGLQIVPMELPSEILIIDHVEKPSERY
jgi:uncharacterized protein (TIGR03435 family)